jgi:hypothetical protein
MLSAVLARDVEVEKVLNPGLPGDGPSHKARRVFGHSVELQRGLPVAHAVSPGSQTLGAQSMVVGHFSQPQPQSFEK